MINIKKIIPQLYTISLKVNVVVRLEFKVLTSRWQSNTLAKGTWLLINTIYLLM